MINVKSYQTRSSHAPKVEAKLVYLSLRNFEVDFTQSTRLQVLIGPFASTCRCMRPGPILGTSATTTTRPSRVLLCVATMVRLAMTQVMVDAIKCCSQLSVKGWPLESVGDEPVLEPAGVGKPISHGQVVDISRILRDYSKETNDRDDLHTETGDFKFSLGALLKGSQVYNAPIKTKSPPVRP